MPKKLPNELPPKRQVDHAIEVMLGVPPPAKAPYQMSHEELKELKVQLYELLAKGYIKPNKSPYGAPVFLVHKKDGTLRMCVDVTTLALGSRPKQRLARLQAKKEAWGSHLMLLGVQKSVRE
jgi:hypothetical protein